MAMYPQTIEIPLTKGFKTIIDAADYEKVKDLKWFANNREGCNYYARTNLPCIIKNGKKFKPKVFLHRLILNAKPGEIVDHINGDTFDNRRCNLRICTESQNLRNRKGLQKNNTTGFMGVDLLRNKYRARIHVEYKEIHVGVFDSAIEAAIARDTAVEKYNDPYWTLNFPNKIKSKRLKRWIGAFGEMVFKVAFYPRGGGIVREMLCRLTDMPKLKVGSCRYNPAKHNLLVVYDMQKGDFRSIPLEGIIAVWAFKKAWRVIE